MNKIPVGISSCLLGHYVRFDGGHKRDSYIVGTLSDYFEFFPYCPEVAIGLGTPRPTIRLVKQNGELRSVGVTNPDMDVTDKLRQYAKQQASTHVDLCGYILKKKIRQVVEWSVLKFFTANCHIVAALVFMPKK
ncbi:DUF523 domain-containing protein [Methylocucumis oryzae]|uniref:DUF523 domain-containing protein n=1 Tax=Methylocucumis oryzae TaxID=1632867 RepID=UPI000A94468B